MGHLHNGILLGHKKEEKFTLWDSMNGLGEYYDNWNKPEEDKYHMISLIYRIHSTNWTNKQNRDRLMDREQDDSYWGEEIGGERMEQKGKRTHGHGQPCGHCRG